MPVGVPFAAPAINLTAQGAISVANFSSLPPAASAPNVVARVADVGAGGSLWYSDGTSWKPVSSAIPLLALSFGASGLSIGPNTGEVWVGSEIMIPAGVVRPGAILTLRVHWQESGVSDSGTRSPRFRTSPTPGGTSGSPILPTFNINSTSSQVVDSFKNIFVSSATNLHANWGTTPGVHGGSGNHTLTGSGFDSDLYVRPAFLNQSTTGTVTLYHASVWLYSGAL